MASTNAELLRRLGQFSVGAFAGACALFAPRLTLMVGHPDNGPITIVALSTTFVVGATLLSLLVGGVAMILEWDGTRSPKDTFMAALGVPALLSGVFSTANVSSEAVRFAQIAKQQADGRAKDEGIVVDDTPQALLAPSRSDWPPTLHLMPTVFAAEQGAVMASAADQKGAAIQYRQVRYWVVFYEDPARDIAQRHAATLGSRYGAVTVQPLGKGFVVTLGGDALPYSDAVSRAVDVKKLSGGTLTPKLVRAG